MHLAIFGSVSSDFLILVVALLLFGKRFPEVATALGRKMYQFKRGIEDLKMEISKPIRDELQGPLKEASELAKSAGESVNSGLRSAAQEAEASTSVSATPAPDREAPAPPAASPGPAPREDAPSPT